ncbi:RidA family protein [Tenuibacillus multivorans]|uniref:2-iminobutanoate/2-iminopropanoate deaminase n=1 Tax=Tenuibacillus multivorans TaxID=237069 RepID=A0A1H0B3C6_9BACI|nr:RidA family protein [Tenuibacillus multivorans]GEL77548.1 reactive intermediate/imine deaminase [Tenuibacillus multivorans]SDN40134.1 2-iminobutanoate/2-iminopropanoate deaminase [Tenuibacillus multivorans]
MKVYSTEQAPSAIGPYSQAVEVGDLIFISGQIPLDPKSMDIVSEDVSKQAEQVMKNVGAILNEAGLDYQNLVKTTIYLKSMDDFATVNEIYANFLKEPYPARAAFEVSKLPKDVKVEIEAIASKA